MIYYWKIEIDGDNSCNKASGPGGVAMWGSIFDKREDCMSHCNNVVEVPSDKREGCMSHCNNVVEVPIGEKWHQI